jgi:hypothetical protein
LDDNRPGAEPVAIISDRPWSEAFGTPPDVIGAVVPTEPVSIESSASHRRLRGARRGERTDI